MQTARRVALVVVLVLSALGARLTASASPTLVAAQHGDFDQYTLALTWQPGICTAAGPPPTGVKRPEHCAAGQPRTPLIGLHGLWASEPHALERTGAPVQSWWARGCDVYQHDAVAPALTAVVVAQLDAVVPHYRESLVEHEYDKHVRCFGFDPNRFFATALTMRRAVAGAAFGRYLTARAGRTVTHTGVVGSFERSFGTTDARAVALECDRDRAGRSMLTQIWINVKTGALASFPSAASLTHTTIDQDTCPATFRLPAW